MIRAISLCVDQTHNVETEFAHVYHNTLAMLILVADQNALLTQIVHAIKLVFATNAKILVQELAHQTPSAKCSTTFRCAVV